MSDDDEDPLGVGKVIEEIDIKPTPEPRKRINSQSPRDLHKLIDIDLYSLSHVKIKSLKKRKSTMLQPSDSLFGPEDEEKIKATASLPYFSVDIPQITVKKNESTSKFEVFLDEEKGNYKYGNVTPAICSTRKQLFDQSIDRVRKAIQNCKLSLDTSVLRKAEYVKDIDALIRKLQSCHYKGIEKMRKNAALHIIYYNKRIKIEQEKANYYRVNMIRMTDFLDYLNSVREKRTFLPIVNLEKFEKSTIPESKKIKKLFKQLKYLDAHKKKITSVKEGKGDWYFNLMYPGTKTSNIIQKFLKKVSVMNYNDLLTIIEHLSDDKTQFDKYEQLLLDLAWGIQPYPFGVSKKAKFPVVNDFFPAVIVRSPLIEKEYAFTPFSVLNGMNWPYKSVVDMIFEMLILTNPFSIAHVFWNVIQEAAECMKNVLIRQGTEPDDVEIDFDSLFPILMICVFVFGVEEWMEVALYTISFNEQVDDDPQLQFSMTYLEGLVTHILAINDENLNIKSAELRKQWADEESDPLGLHN